MKNFLPPYETLDRLPEHSEVFGSYPYHLEPEVLRLGKKYKYMDNGDKLNELYSFSKVYMYERYGDIKWHTLGLDGNMAHSIAWHIEEIKNKRLKIYCRCILNI